MSNTVQQFAAELKKSVPTLLEQLKAAGVEKSSGADSISPADKQALLAHLRKQNDSGTVSISVSRTRTERSTVAGVQVETRRRRRVAVPPIEAVAESKPAAEAAPVQPAAAPVAEKAPAAAPAVEEPNIQVASKAAETTVVETPTAETTAAKADATPAATEAATPDDAPAAEAKPKRSRKPKKEKAPEPAPQPVEVVSAAEQAMRDEEARRAEALRAHQQALLKEKQERQARREAAKLQAQQEAKLAKEQQSAPRSAAPSEKAPLSSGNAAPGGGRPKKGDRHQQRDDDMPRGRSAKGKGKERNNRGDDERVRGGKKGKKQLKLEPNQHAFQAPTEPVVHEVLVPETITVADLAHKMAVKGVEVVKALMKMGMMVTINQSLDQETALIVVEEMGHIGKPAAADDPEAFLDDTETAVQAEALPRPPVVTVMGHVDHGKTSLLDYIRRAKVVQGEAGGITQHIGAYHVQTPRGVITFLDTPGHEAFTAMRARGAQVTDIAIIIIAADDSVMPTTKEAIAHAQAANVPMVFAINKIDKPGANPDKIREDLSQMNLLVEEWGGKYQCQEISAKKGVGVNELLEKVLLEAEMLDLKANPNRKGTGSIIESSLDKGRGYVSTLLVSNGTLHVGDNVIAGTSWGRIKAMFNERNQRIESAGPAEPAIILGLNGAPTAGDAFHVLETEQEARDIANKREQLQREQGLRTQTRLTLSDISHRIARGEFHEMNIIVKGDTDGSIDVISKAVGQISENDVMLAAASDAVIVGFQVRPSADARKLADRDGVEINTYSVIYDAIDDVTSAMVGMLDKVKKEIVTGQVEVQQVFKISKVGTVAGCIVTEGKVHSKDKGRVIRDGIVIHTAPISALKRYKDDVKEVVTGLECGISLVNYNDLQTGDMIETFTEIEVEQKL